MSRISQRNLAHAALEAHGRTYCQEIGIRLENTPAPLYQLLNAALMLSARIPAGNAVEALQALLEAKLTTPEKMADATWQQRVDVITDRGYKRYDERTSTMLGETAERLLETYHGDLRRLRDEADRVVEQEHHLLQQFKGVGDVGAHIFLREVQMVWEEAYPYADPRVCSSSEKLGLPNKPDALADLVDRRDFPRLVCALMRIELADAYNDVRRAARES